ncbi:E3 ubiquitin-protein ligase parkin [Coccinella septempunctata]|uniref:E3 ubiquitin-protein ligase parkin n=1 Tax=Coccinella septempunctata TaxID=41139 RepID=UPI001D0670BC|nr:E3 ubiquitin-protein ligase parkin [Coccinella septempunctata]
MTSVLFTLKSFVYRILNMFGFGQKSITDSLNIFIKTNTGSTVSVNLDRMWDIREVKQMVAPQLGLEPKEFKIIFAGKELKDTITLAECNLGQRSTLHAVKIKKKIETTKVGVIEEEDSGSKPLNETLQDTSFYDLEEDKKHEDNSEGKVHFYVYCPTCKSLKNGKLRVICEICKSGAFTVYEDPQNWDDVLKPKQILGYCENEFCESKKMSENEEFTFAEFFFKCCEHTSLGENDRTVPLHLIKTNLKDIPCLSCADVCNPVLVFPCKDRHVICIDCFKQYCTVRLSERQFWQHPEHGYTLSCPIGCADSFIEELHHFRLLSETQYAQYQKFATEEFVLRSGGVLCPQPGCGMGILIDEGCKKISCLHGCGYVFCRDCLQGYHIGECQTNDETTDSASCLYSVDPTKASSARWDEASKIAIRVLTKPCPKCRTPTERDGGCMHMVCSRAGCEYHWCWVCQGPWTRECMGNHWFG